MTAPKVLSPLLAIPSEILLLIASHLDVPQILSLRQTCSALYKMSCDRSIWLNILRDHQRSLPLPADLRGQNSSPYIVNLPSTTLESIVSSTHRIERSWLLPRRNTPFKLQPKSGESLLGLELFLDKWLLSVYSEGLVYLWDIDPDMNSHSISGVRCASLDLGCRGWTTYAVALDAESKYIILAVTRVQGPSTTRIYQICLTHPSIFSPNPIQFLHTFVRPFPHVVRALDPAHHLIAFSRSYVVDIVHWTADELDMDRNLTISAQTEDLEDLWNGIIDVCFIGPYLFVFKTRSIELFPLPTQCQSGNVEGQPLPILRHPLAYTTFRDVYFSQIEHIPQPVTKAGDVFRFSLLAYDVIQGLFHYNISINIPASSSPPSLDVNLTGIYPMAHTIHVPSPVPPTIPSSSSAIQPAPTQGTYTPTPEQIQTHTQFYRSTGSVSSRGFISAYSLGPQGRRALWVERSRGSTIREVIVCGARGWNGDGDGKTVEMDGKAVYTVESYDLREDITDCALGEVSGRIVLGNRAGDIFVLGLGT